MDNNNDQLPSIEGILGSSSIWVILTVIIIGVFLMNTLRFDRVTGEQVGVLLNKMNGSTQTVNEAGMRIYNGLTHKFFILDKKIQTLEMTSELRRGDRPERDDLKVKTMDGSDVYVDLIVQFKIDPVQAELVIRTSGPGELYKQKWARDYVRTVVRDHLGELTTEEFYDSNKRNKKIQAAEQEVRKELLEFGIIIDRIDIPKKPHFYKEYEEMIKKKKLADQAVLEEKSKAHAAKQKQQTLIVEETNKKNVAVEQFRGKMEQKIISAKAEAEKTRKKADAYYDQTTIGAGAFLYQMEKNASGVLTKKEAEAKGIEAMKKALEGEGGRNMVKMEYARKLKGINITGKPYTYDAHTERFKHLTNAGASQPVISAGKGGNR